MIGINGAPQAFGTLFGGYSSPGSASRWPEGLRLYTELESVGLALPDGCCATPATVDRVGLGPPLVVRGQRGKLALPAYFTPHSCSYCSW